MQDALQAQVVVNWEMAHHVLTVPHRRRQDMPEQRWPAVQEHDGVGVAAHDAVRISGVSGDHLADEAGRPHQA